MKKLLLSTAAIAAMGMFAGSAMADNFASSTATAEVAAPLTVTVGQAMNFGKFSVDAGTTSGSLTSDRNTVDGVTVHGAGNLDATFDVTGEDTPDYTVSTDGSSSVLTNVEDSTKTIAFGVTETHTDMTSGQSTITVKGTLSGLDSNTASGNYEGTVKVTANYI